MLYNNSYGQNIQIDSVCVFNIKFAHYLIQKSQYEDALFLLEDSSFVNCNSCEDEINYLKGWTYYYKKELEISSEWLNKVSKQSKYFYKSKFFSFYNNAHLLKLDTAESIINEINDTNNLIMQVKNFEKAALQLLKRDISAFDELSKNFKPDYYILDNHQQELIKTKDKIVKQKFKSKYLSGGLSMVIPGLGKIYAGNVGEGIAGFFTVGGLAAITIESIIKAGITDYKTIIFGSIFSIFYIGNIYGSMITVKNYKNEITNAQNITILYNMHIPLRSLFD